MISMLLNARGDICSEVFSIKILQWRLFMTEVKPTQNTSFSLEIWLQSVWNTNHLKCFLCLSSTPKDDSSSTPMTFPESKSFLHQDKGNNTGMQTYGHQSILRKATWYRRRARPQLRPTLQIYSLPWPIFLLLFLVDNSENTENRNFTV